MLGGQQLLGKVLHRVEECIYAISTIMSMGLFRTEGKKEKLE